ncbi:MAG: carbohydrate porin, partial [Rickettsiales bacterium]
FDVDSEKAFGLANNTININFLNNFGGNPNSYAGSIEGLSSIETTPSTFKLFEFWTEQSFFEDRASVKVGLYDTNSEFFFTNMSAGFLKPTMETSQEMAQTGQNGLSAFPTTSLGARIKFIPSKDLYVQAAILDGEPGNSDRKRGTHIDFEDDDGTFQIAELGYTPNASDEGAFNKLAVGAWRYTKKFDDVVDVDDNGDALKKDSRGVYGLASAYLYKCDTGKTIGAFLRGGVGDGDTGQTDWSYATGLVGDGWIPSRPAGQIGLGFTQAHNGDKHMRAQDAGTTERSEYGVEVYYSDQLMDGVNIQPDFQYIKHPGTSKTVDDAVALGLRLSVGL